MPAQAFAGAGDDDDEWGRQGYGAGVDVGGDGSVGCGGECAAVVGGKMGHVELL